jgi:hypothetical protein
MSVYTPPNILLADLGVALCKSYTKPASGDISSGIMTVFYDTDAGKLAATLDSSFRAIGTVLTQQEISAAVAIGFKFVGK